MPWRYLAPAHSPVSAGSLAGALKGLALGAPAGLDQWLARRFEVDAALLVDSGTSALRLAMEAAAPSPGSGARVALPAYGCFDLATAAIGAGCVVLFYDVDPSTLGPDWDSLSAALAAGMDALVVVHQYGIPVDIDQARAAGDGVLIIEDAAQGAGAWARQHRLGARGDLGILSFGRGKGMTAGGGGALLAAGSRGRELLAQASKRTGGGRRGAGSVVRLAAQAVLSHPLLYGIPAHMPGLNLGNTPFHAPWQPRSIEGAQAGAVRAAAELADREAEARRRNASRLSDLLRERRGVASIKPTLNADNQPGWLRFPVLLEDAAKARVMANAGRHLGIAPGYPLPLPQLPQLLRVVPGDWPGASALASRLVTLPTHQDVKEPDLLALATLLS